MTTKTLVGAFFFGSWKTEVPVWVMEVLDNGSAFKGWRDRFAWIQIQEGYVIVGWRSLDPQMPPLDSTSIFRWEAEVIYASRRKPTDPRDRL